MKQKLTDEQLKIVRNTIKNNDEISLDDDYFEGISLSLSVERGPNRYFFSHINLDFEEAIPDERLRYYQVHFDLVYNDDILARIAFMDIRMVSLYADEEERAMAIDESGDSDSTIGYFFKMDEIQLSPKHFQYMMEVFPSAGVNIAELHTFYISPEFRGLRIADFLYSHLNDLLYAEYNQVIYLLGVYINPFKEQCSLEQIDFGVTHYDENVDEDGELFRVMYRALERNGFKSFGKGNRHFYKNMFDD